MTDLDRIILNFLNENKLYPTNIINNLTKKLGDSSNETLNKLAIFGLFRQAPPFNTIKYINQLSSLDQLNDLFDKWKESALQQLVGSRGELKGNKTASMTYLDAYINNIASLGNNAKPFSYKDTEQTLIDVCNNNKWVKQNDVATQTYGVEKPHDSDIVFEDDNIIILKGSSKAKCIAYGQGYTWCISQSQLNSFNYYRVDNGATIYFVLNKKLPKDDNERVVVVLRYPNNVYGIADAKNDDRSGLDYEGNDFNYVVRELPWLKGMEKYFPENKLTQSEKDYQTVISIKYDGNDLGNYIINKSKELKLNGDDIDPVDFLRDYIHYISDYHIYITTEQFNSLTEPMKIQLVEMGAKLNDDIIKSLNSNLKIRYGVKFYSLIDLMDEEREGIINLNLYTVDEIKRLIFNLKDKLNYEDLNNIFYMLSKDVFNQILPEIILVVQGSSYKEKMINELYNILFNLDNASDEVKYNIIKQLLPLTKDYIKFDDVYELYESVNDENYKYLITIDLIKLLDKSKLIEMTSTFLNSETPENNFQITKLLFPLIKDNLTPEILNDIFEPILPEDIDLLIPQIIPLIIDKLDNDLIKVILDWTDDVDKPKINRLIKQYRKQQPVNENKQKDVVNELRLIVRKILKENY